ncbi:hypothetical protein Bbelb_128930 [Branchiostoma belcheri]|nr:hypothetical protein Bbelb_128930 [Branchiostoma belcheri]
MTRGPPTWIGLLARPVVVNATPAHLIVSCDEPRCTRSGGAPGLDSRTFWIYLPSFAARLDASRLWISLASLGFSTSADAGRIATMVVVRIRHDSVGQGAVIFWRRDQRGCTGGRYCEEARKSGWTTDKGRSRAGGPLTAASCHFGRGERQKRPKSNSTTVWLARTPVVAPRALSPDPYGLEDLLGIGAVPGQVVYLVLFIGYVRHVPRDQRGKTVACVPCPLPAELHLFSGPTLFAIITACGSKDGGIFSQNTGSSTALPHNPNQSTLLWVSRQGSPQRIYNARTPRGKRTCVPPGAGTRDDNSGKARQDPDINLQMKVE